MEIALELMAEAAGLDCEAEVGRPVHHMPSVFIKANVQIFGNTRWLTMFPFPLQLLTHVTTTTKCSLFITMFRVIKIY